MIVWLNGTFGAGKTTTATELAGLLPWLRRAADTVVETAGVEPHAVAGRIAAAVRA